MNREAKMIADTLAWCNQKRAEMNKPPIEELPKGEKGDGYSCPCGKATGLWVGMYSYEDPETMVEGCIPSAVENFVMAFDSGMLPELTEGE